MNRTLSRREKKKATDGVTLTGINQTGDQTLQNKPSRWVQGTILPGKGPLGPLHTLGCPQRGHLACPDAPWAPERCWAGPQGISEEEHPSTWCQSCGKIQKGSLCHRHTSGPK